MFESFALRTVELSFCVFYRVDLVFAFNRRFLKRWDAQSRGLIKPGLGDDSYYSRIFSSLLARAKIWLNPGCMSVH